MFSRVLSLAVFALAMASIASAQSCSSCNDCNNNFDVPVGVQQYLGYLYCESAGYDIMLGSLTVIATNINDYASTFTFESELQNSTTSGYYYTVGSISTPTSCFNPASFGGDSQGVYFYATCITGGVVYSCPLALAVDAYCTPAGVEIGTDLALKTRKGSSKAIFAKNTSL
jgi:hypothetical protein